MALERYTQLQSFIQDHTPYQLDTLEMVAGDASFRKYYRFTDAASGQSIIAVDAPPEHENAAQFIHVANAYAQERVPVPLILAHDIDKGFYLQQDMGNTLLADKLDASNFSTWYQRAIDILPSIQACQRTCDDTLPDYDDALLARESHLFTHWLLSVHLGLALSPDEQHLVDESLAKINAHFAQVPRAGVHRDYHSRNIMVGDHGLSVIDFQDAVIGPVTYDLVSLLKDCYCMWPQPQVKQLVEYARAKYFADYKGNFQRDFDWVGMQRHIKASGIFARLYHRDGKVGYLDDIPRTLQHLITACGEYDALSEFGQWVAERVLPAVAPSHPSYLQQQG